MNVYEAMEKPEVWPFFLDRLRVACGSASANLSSRHLATGHEQGLQTGFDEREIRLYFEHYGKVHPWLPKTPAAFRHQPEVKPTDSLLPLAQLRRTEFYNDWGRRNEVVFAAAARVWSAQGSVLFLAVNQGERQGPVSAQALTLLERLLPHCQQALRLSDIWGQAISARASWRGGPLATFLLAPDARLIDATEAAERLLAKVGGRFRLGAGRRLSIGGERGRNVVPVLMSRLCGNQYSGQETLQLDAVADEQECILVARRRGAASPGIPVTGPPLEARIELTVIAPRGIAAEAGSAAAGRLSEVYALTAAEGRLLAALVTAGSLVAACRKLSISRETGKSQLAAIFRKTDTRSQSELTAMAARLAAVHHPIG